MALPFFKRLYFKYLVRFKLSLIKSLEKRGDKVHIGLLGIVLAHALLCLPGIPLSSGLETRHDAGLISGVVSERSLLEESVDLLFLLV